MERRYGAETKGRIYVSALPDTPMAVMAKEEGCVLPMPTQPGGAYSALTAATLLPLAAAGVDPLEVLEGAAEAYSQYDLRAFENPVGCTPGRGTRSLWQGPRHGAARDVRPGVYGVRKNGGRSGSAATPVRDGVGVLPVPMERPAA